jgi:DNA-binding CsgD family transcriptional regulator
MSAYPLFPARESVPASRAPDASDDEADRHSAGQAVAAGSIELDGRRVDQLLLEAFLGARRRFRGAVVAISDRTMITNTGASELLQPEDRQSLWYAAQSAGCHTTDRNIRFVLRSGMTVYRSCYPVESDGRLVGVVVHLQVAPPARRLSGSLQSGPLAPGGGWRPMLHPADPTLLTGWSDLTDSERTVAELVGQGLSNRQTGRRLFMSPHTVDYHLRRVYRKLGIHSRVELARLLGEHYELLADATPEDRIA